MTIIGQTLHKISRGKKKTQLFKAILKEAFEYCVDPSLSLNLLIIPTKLLPTDVVSQEDKPLEWIDLQHKGHKVLILLSW